MSVVCICGASMVLRNSKYGKFYGCSQYPKCQETHGAHPDGSPLGIPADKETRDLRIEGHKLLSTIWDYRDKKQRKEMYKWLKENTTLGHISMLMKDEIRLLIERLKKAELKGEI
jgi:ssDNA-binding Zn-finger/Zn-ribbon topoisomerase 1